MRKTFFILLAAYVVLSCSKSSSGPASSSGSFFLPPSPSANGLILTDLSYGSHESEKMDLYLPPGRNTSKTPLVILIHGGRWQSGDKQEMTGYLNALRSGLPDFAFANINYRLAEPVNHKFPAQELSVQSAFNFLWNLSDSFKIAKKFAMIGESAGGQLALLHAFKSGRSSLKACIGVGAPSNFEDWYLNPISSQTREIQEFVTGGTLSQLPAIYAGANAFNFAGNNSPETLLIHGSSDGVVPLRHATELVNQLNNFSAPAHLKILEDQSHNLTPDGFAKVYEHIINFLKTPNLFK
jgi:acetyl esterase/lipase